MSCSPTWTRPGSSAQPHGLHRRAARLSRPSSTSARPKRCGQRSTRGRTSRPPRRGVRQCRNQLRSRLRNVAARRIDAMDLVVVSARHRVEPDGDLHDHPLGRRTHEAAAPRQHHRHRLDRRHCARSRWSAMAMSRQRRRSTISCATPPSTLRSYNVRVNAIAPGPFLTNIAGGRLHREPEVVRKIRADGADGAARAAR